MVTHIARVCDTLDSRKSELFVSGIISCLTLPFPAIELDPPQQARAYSMPGIIFAIKNRGMYAARKNWGGGCGLLSLRPRKKKAMHTYLPILKKVSGPTYLFFRLFSPPFKHRGRNCDFKKSNNNKKLIKKNAKRSLGSNLIICIFVDGLHVLSLKLSVHEESISVSLSCVRFRPAVSHPRLSFPCLVRQKRGISPGFVRLCCLSPRNRWRTVGARCDASIWTPRASRRPTCTSSARCFRGCRGT